MRQLGEVQRGSLIAALIFLKWIFRHTYAHAHTRNKMVQRSLNLQIILRYFSLKIT